MPLTRAVVDGDKCSKEQHCPPMDECPSKAIVNVDGYRFVTNDCRGCKKCVTLCKRRAIKMV